VTKKNIDRVLKDLVPSKKRSKRVVESDIAMRQVVYHRFARAYGWTRQEVDSMSVLDVVCELVLHAEDLRNVPVHNIN